MTNDGKIYAALANINAKVEAIAKDKTNSNLKFAFRSVDDVYNLLSPLMKENRVFTVPKVLQRFEKPVETNSGTIWCQVALEVEYTLYADDGSNVVGVVWGEGKDNADKASNKALTAAHKYFLLQVFTIPTEDLGSTDADQHHFPNEAPKGKPASAPPTKPKPDSDWIPEFKLTEEGKTRAKSEGWPTEQRPRKDGKGTYPVVKVPSALVQLLTKQDGAKPPTTQDAPPAAKVSTPTAEPDAGTKDAMCWCGDPRSAHDAKGSCKAPNCGCDRFGDRLEVDKTPIGNLAPPLESVPPTKAYKVAMEFQGNIERTSKKMMLDMLESAFMASKEIGDEERNHLKGILASRRKKIAEMGNA
jgi:hypothetical protein